MGFRDVISYRAVVVGLAAGLLFAAMDGLINANPVAQRLYAAFRPIARESVNAPLGLVVDLVSGIVMALLFVSLMPVLPTGSLIKGIVFGLMVWFFRVAMGSASQFVMFRVPVTATLYALLTGLVEMIGLGLFIAAFLGAR